MITFMGMLQFILTGGLTLLASTLIKHYQATDDIVQWIYPSVAVFSLWLSSFLERRGKENEIKSKIQNEKEKWIRICLEIKKSKDHCIEKIVSSELTHHKKHESILKTGIKNAILDLQPKERDLQLQTAKIKALSERNKEILVELDLKEQHIEFILASRNSLEKKVSEFIGQLRQFHQEMNRELKDNNSQNSSMWASIDTLADKIYLEINSFNSYISALFIEERMSREPMNRKGKNQLLDEDFSAPMKQIDSRIEKNNRKSISPY